MIAYRAMLDVSREVATTVAALLQQRRADLGTRRGRRALSCYRQAVLVLHWFRDRARVDQLARDNRISAATAYRYVHEGIGVLAAAAPDLDGTLIRADRVAALTDAGNDLWYSGKHKSHGGNIQFLAHPGRFPAVELRGASRLGPRPQRRPRTCPPRAVPGRRRRPAHAGR